MIRAIRPQAMAQDDASLVTGWNLSPNVAYVVQLNPGSSACGVLVYNEGQTAIIASGAGLVGTDQPVILHPYAGQSIGMIDADLGWHLLLTTEGTESPRTVRIGPAVDLPDEIHPIYADDDLAVARATAGVDDHAHYIDDVTVACPLGFGAWIGDVARTPMDGAAIDGQTESLTWTGTPNGVNEQAVVRLYVPIAPDAFVEITPPTVADDTGTATHLAGTSGNVLANDESGLVVTAVNGLAANVGLATDGNNGGSFTINADGSWTFSPDGDFALLGESETADTAITYHASDGTSEASASLTVTVSHANATPVAVDDTATTDAATAATGNVLTNDTDADLDTLSVSKVNGAAGNVGVAVAGSAGGLFTIASSGAWTFDPNGDFALLEGSETADTSVTYHASDGVSESSATLTVTVSSGVAELWTPSQISGLKLLDAAVPASLTYGATPKISQWADAYGGSLVAAQSTAGLQPEKAVVDGVDCITFDNVDDFFRLNYKTNGGSYMIFIAYDLLSQNTNQTDCFFAEVNSDTNSYGSIAFAYQGTLYFKQYRDANWATCPISVGKGLVCFRRENGVSSRIYKNGVLSATAACPSNTTASSYFMTIGHNPDYSGTPIRPFDGSFAKVLIVPSAISDDDRQKIEGWVAWQCQVWGLVDALPSDHPYKSAPPYVE